MNKKPLGDIQAEPIAYFEQSFVEANDKVVSWMRFKELPWIYTPIYTQAELQKFLEYTGQDKPEDSCWPSYK